MSKIEKNKKQKENSLYDAAYHLFTTKGIHNTAISDIVKKAGVGKGTFYLYFKNKYDILDKIILDKSTYVLSEAIKQTKEKEFNNFEDELLYFIDYIIEYLRKDRLMLKLIHKNLSWGIFKKAYKDYEEIHEIYSMFQSGYKNSSLSRDYIGKVLFMILELTGSVCYSSIILEEPVGIDEMKPVLFQTIRKII
ncbi:TetR/AcrR family transcriptional regulator [Anaerosalibacter massiliensis]|uniref:TetR/AcrR family transcriptional regulator n=1 Tax=Anaerosalibacter massiliensis TaxID=1347392 RepID=A0A9X2MFP0_9FIRM|nr:TetR/AcrR family transcriptional regulator [Anaerosalibacter massiliensis]MCR2044152.1 TetR/AcrR family transcriptional regulator [Anaerosalibacter massiliensis]